jgi:hypothetical protein
MYTQTHIYNIAHHNINTLPPNTYTVRAYIIMHFPDNPAQFQVNDISHDRVNLSWSRLPESDVFPHQIYNITCNGSSQTTSLSTIVLKLDPSTPLYNCSVVGISETGKFTSLHSFELLFMLGKSSAES